MTARKKFCCIAVGLILHLIIVTSLTLAQGPKTRSIPPPHEEFCETPCEITGSELLTLIGKALSDPSVDYTKEALENEGYYFLPDSCCGWKQSKIPGTQPAATMIILSFGIDTDPTRAAFICWGFSEGDTGYSAAEFYWGDQCPFPDYEEVEEDTWIKGVSSSGEGYSPPDAGKNFWKCWLVTFGAGCSGCAFYCAFTDGGYFHCLGICCGASVIGGGIGCLLSLIL